jgi:transcriptional regulator with XRE-family HTH domain
LEEDNGIGRRLRAARLRRGWSREALAFRSGMSWSAIAQVEAGRRRNLRPSTLSALAGALGVTIDYVVSGRASTPPMLEHHALLYESDAEFLATAMPFLTDSIERSEPALVVTTAANIELLRDQLGRRARQVEFADRSSWFRAPVSAVNGFQSFRDAQLEAGAPWIRIIGEPVWDGLSDSDIRSWVRCESLLNVSWSTAPATVLCAYDTRAVARGIVNQAHLTHSHTIQRGQVASSPEYADPSEFVLES